MDYDTTDIASTYDLGRDHGPEFLDLWMNVVASHVKDQSTKTILDLGCGTGRFTEALRARFDANVIGVDPSEKMLARARSKLSGPGIRYEIGRAEAIPLPDNSFDLVFMSMIFHHLEDPLLAARESRRVLRDGGTSFVRTGIRERISSYPYFDFFPESRPILEEILPTKAFVREVFEAAGFRTVIEELVTQEIAPSYTAYAKKLGEGADSVLARLSRGDFDDGMRALRAHAAHADGKAVYEPIDVFVFQSPP
jgi:ubiquinone/menaquinone biosynthesis C-methylase UbiE